MYQRNNDARKISGKRIVIFIVIILAAVSIFPLPIPVNKTVTGVEFQTGSSEVAEEQVVIKGIYFRYLFRNSIFKGDISIKSKTTEENQRLLDVQLFRNPYMKGKAGSLNYYSGKQNKIVSLGELQVVGNFKEIMIWYPYQKDEKERFFISSAADYEEAVKKADQLTKGMFEFGAE